MGEIESPSRKKRRPPGGISITRRGDKYEATHNVPKAQLPPGSPRKRITAWGDSETSATKALLMKLKEASLLPPAAKTKLENQRKNLKPTFVGDSEHSRHSHRFWFEDQHLGPTLESWAREWERVWMKDSLDESTKQIYIGHVNTHILPYLGKYHLNELSAKVLKEQWWDKIAALRKLDADGVPTTAPLLGDSARANIYKTLRMMLGISMHKHGTRMSLTEKLIELPKAKRPESDAQIVRAAGHLRQKFIDNPDKGDERWSLFALTLLGLRQAERLGICLSDIDLDEDDPTITIHQQLAFLKSEGGWYLKPTTKNKQSRVVPLWGIFLEAVNKQIEWREQWASQPDWNPDPEFADLLYLQPGGKLWTRRQDTPEWHGYVGSGIRGHLARHITGYLLAEEGVSVATAGVLLGHKSEIYIKYYRQNEEKIQRRKLRQIELQSKMKENITPITKNARRSSN